MISTGQRSVEFLAVMLENAELRQALTAAQDQCVELAVIAGELHGEIEALRLRLSEVEQCQAGSEQTRALRSAHAGDQHPSLLPAT